MIQKIFWLTGMPRSGTTWISQIFASNPDIKVKFCPLFSYTFKNALDETATKDQWQTLFEKVFITADDYMDQQHLRKKGLVPDFAKDPNADKLLIKSNRFHNLTEPILKECQDVKFISIIRHPCAAIYSWISNPLEFPEGQDPKQQWRSGTCRKTGKGEFWGFEDWKMVTSLHIRLAKEWPEHFFIQRYENFVQAPLETTQALFEKLDLPLTTATPTFIKETQSRHDTHRRSVYKDPRKLKDWKRCLNKEIAKQIQDELKNTELEIFLNE